MSCYKKCFRLSWWGFIVLIIVSMVVVKPSKATISGCSATVSPGTAQPNSTGFTFNFTVTNNDPSQATYWMQITRPFAGVTLTSSQGLSGWNNTTTAETATYTEYLLNPGESMTPWVIVNIADGDASGNWVVKMVDDPGGNNPVQCTGSLALTVSGVGTDTNAPVISGVSVTNITTSQATINWTTDETSNSRVEYGLESGIYSLSEEYTTMVTTHSMIISSGVAGGTTYYYRICSTDAVGNRGCTSENSFTSASVATTTTTTTTIIVVATPTPTPSSATGTVVATPPPVILDLTKPTVSISTELQKSYETAPELAGSASDNKIISKAEYSVDGGINWLPMDTVEGLGTGSVSFSFIPQLTEDGNFDVVVRAVDNSGNIGLSETKVIVIDRLPPRVGTMLLSIGPYTLLPDKNGVIVTLAGVEEKIVVSAVGGATSVDISSGNKKFSLGKSAETGLWRGAINFPDPGVYELFASAIDGAGNTTERKLGVVLVLPYGQITKSESGKVVGEGEITVQQKDPASQIWTEWDAKAFSQNNPQKLKEGKYSFFLPPGTYYLTIKVPDQARLTSEIFTLNQSTPLNADFEVMPPKVWKIFGLSIPLPDIWGMKAQVTIKRPELSGFNAYEEVLGDLAEMITLPISAGGNLDMNSLKGEQQILSFVNTWSPQSLQQITLLTQAIKEKQLKITLVFSQESLPKVALFAKRGGYESPFLVDRDGELLESYQVASVPTHYFLSRTGEIKSVQVGVLSPEEFEQELLRIDN